MDDVRLKRAWYRIALERELLRRKGNAYQDLFSDIMEKRYPEDFIRVRPWGRLGDRKNDGYLRSARTLFQLYAPNEMSSKDAINKIDEDFTDAIPYWKAYFNKWVFVHNSQQGLGPEVTAKLLALSNQNPSITVTSWGSDDLCRVALLLSEDELSGVLGGIIAPTELEIIDVSYANIKWVFESILRQPELSEPDIRPVPPEKLEKSGLSSDAAFLLTLGMRKSDRVRNFLETWPDPQYGNQVVESFRNEYQSLKLIGLGPEAIFHELLAFAGGLGDATSTRRGAVLAVLAYLFEECEIFERPEEVAP